MRATLTVVVVSLILVLAALPLQAQEANLDLLGASMRNLRAIAPALQNYFTAVSMYPQSISELVPDFITARPEDPCTVVQFGSAPGYTYSPIGNPATDYLLRTNWTSGGSGTPCWVANNRNFQFIPRGGLVLTP